MTAPSQVGSGTYLLETLPDGGVLLDLASGALFELNVSAAFVWSRMLGGAREAEIGAAYAHAFSVDESIAHKDVASALSPRVDWPPPPTAETHYEFLGDRYRFSVAGVPEIEISESGESLRSLHTATPAELYRSLRTLSPKLLALLGVPVLHASAVRRPGGDVVAFLGESGAGKTTTARVFQAAGFELLSEDKVILDSDQDGTGMTVISAGESNIDVWLRATAMRISTVPHGEWCDLGRLREAASGERCPLGRVILLDESRRAGSAFQLTALGPTAATTSIFRNAFYGSYSVEEWTRYLHVAIAVTRSAEVFAATVPNGSAALQQAIVRYAEITQS